jgi:hypothetical protein
MFNEIIAEFFQNFKKEIAIQVQEAFSMPNRQTRKEYPHVLL